MMGAWEAVLSPSIGGRGDQAPPYGPTRYKPLHQAASRAGPNPAFCADQMAPGPRRAPPSDRWPMSRGPYCLSFRHTAPRTDGAAAVVQRRAV